MHETIIFHPNGAPTMPTWSNRLPPEGAHKGFDLRRTPASRPLQAVITCESLLVCDTHYWHGRTAPCERTVNEDGKTVDDTACPACREKQGWRTHAYVSCFDYKTREHFIFECTSNAAKPLQDYYDACGTLRGCILYAARPKGAANSKVVIQTNTANLAKNPLPNPPDIARALCVIWRLPADTLLPQDEYTPDLRTDDRFTPKASTARVNGSKLTAMRTQDDTEARRRDLLATLEGSGSSHTKQVSA